MSKFRKEGFIQRKINEALRIKESNIIMVKSMNPEEAAEHIFSKVLSARDDGLEYARHHASSPYSEKPHMCGSKFLNGEPFHIPLFFEDQPEPFRQSVKEKLDIEFIIGFGKKTAEVEVLEQLNDIINKTLTGNID